MGAVLISTPPVVPSAFTAHSYDARVGPAGQFKVNPDQEHDTFSGGSPTVQVTVLCAYVCTPLNFAMDGGWME